MLARQQRQCQTLALRWNRSEPGCQEGPRSTSCAQSRLGQLVRPRLPPQKTIWQSSTGNRVSPAPSANRHLSRHQSHARGQKNGTRHIPASDLRRSAPELEEALADEKPAAETEHRRSHGWAAAHQLRLARLRLLATAATRARLTQTAFWRQARRREVRRWRDQGRRLASIEIIS